MDELDSYCPLADAGGDTLDRAVSHIAGCEDAGDTGLQEERIAIKRPMLCKLCEVDSERTHTG